MLDSASTSVGQSEEYKMERQIETRPSRPQIPNAFQKQRQRCLPVPLENHRVSLEEGGGGQPVGESLFLCQNDLFFGGAQGTLGQAALSEQPGPVLQGECQRERMADLP